MRFGQKVRELRQNMGLTQRQLADRMDVSFSYISKVENERLHFGDYPSEKFIHKLAAELDGDEDELLLLADKVIGKAAALLCLKAGIKIIYAGVISTPALEILKENCIPVGYGNEVTAIENRTKTGLCPMESLSRRVESPDVMYNKIIEWMSSE